MNELLEIETLLGRNRSKEKNMFLELSILIFY